MIFWEGESADTLFFLISGIVKVFKTSPQGKEQIISFARPYEVLNDISIFDTGPNPVSAQASSTGMLFGIEKDKLESILRQYPRIAMSIIRVLTERTRQLLSLVEDLSFKHVIGRVGKILLGHAGDGDGKQKLTQQEMAAMAGTAREVVARSLKSLEERGIIQLERNRIVVKDKKALEEMVTESV
jgi:CRP-like cAMP-binding protein